MTPKVRHLNKIVKLSKRLQYKDAFVKWCTDHKIFGFGVNK